MLTEQLPTFGLPERAAKWLGDRLGVVVFVGLFAGAAFGSAVCYWIAGPGTRLGWTVIAGLLGAGAGGAGTATVYAVIRLVVRRDRAVSQLQALVNVRPLTGKLPLDLGTWAADPVLADAVVRLLVRKRPRRVVECGSGWSTVLTAACLHELGKGRVQSLEHLEWFARETRRLVELFGGRDRAEVLLAPITNHRVNGERRPWYDDAALGDLFTSIDVLVVDGPPGSVGHRSRYPAVPLLRDRLADDATVLLDDAKRDDERWIAREWTKILGVEPDLVRRGDGVWIWNCAEGSSA